MKVNFLGGTMSVLRNVRQFSETVSYAVLYFISSLLVYVSITFVDLTHNHISLLVGDVFRDVVGVSIALESRRLLSSWLLATSVFFLAFLTAIKIWSLRYAKPLPRFKWLLFSQFLLINVVGAVVGEDVHFFLNASFLLFLCSAWIGDRLISYWKEQSVVGRRLYVLATFFLIYWVFAIIYHVTYFRTAHEATSVGYAFTDLFADRWFFNIDLCYQLGSTADLNPYLSGRMNGYPPFAYVVIYIHAAISTFLTNISANVLSVCGMAFSVMAVLFIAGWVGFNLKIRHRILVLGLLPIIFCYPTVFLFYRGNLDMLFMPLLLAFIWRYHSVGRGELPLAILAAYKPQFAVLAAVYLFDRSYARFAVCAGVAFLITVVSLLLLNGSVYENIVQFSKIQHDIEQHFGLQNLGVRYGHSFSNLYKLILFWSGIDFNTPARFSIYKYSSLLFLAAVCLLLYMKSELYEPYERLTIVFLLMLGVPYWSYDYKLVILAPLLVLYAGKYNRFILVLLALILIPKHYYFISISEFTHPYLTPSAFITPALLLISVVAILSIPFLRRRQNLPHWH